VLAVPDAVALSVKLQSEMELTSMYWPSQKSAPFGCVHRVLQPPVSVAEQSALH
jgi:hypothetical protein